MPYRCIDCQQEFPDPDELLDHVRASADCGAATSRLILGTLNPGAVRCARCDTRLTLAWHPTRDGFVCEDCLTPAERAEANREVDEIRDRPRATLSSQVACAGLLAGCALGMTYLCILKAMEVAGA